MRLFAAVLLVLVPAYAASMALKPRQTDSEVHLPPLLDSSFLYGGLTSIVFSVIHWQIPIVDWNG
jgi:hypothetical protein